MMGKFGLDITTRFKLDIGYRTEGLVQLYYHRYETRRCIENPFFFHLLSKGINFSFLSAGNVLLQIENVSCNPNYHLYYTYINLIYILLQISL